MMNNYFFRYVNNVFRMHQKTNNGFEQDLFFGEFYIGKEAERAKNCSWAYFRKICKKSVELEASAFIIQFMYRVFQISNKYDMQRIEIILKEIKTVNGVDLATLCAEFFRYANLLNKEQIESGYVDEKIIYEKAMDNPNKLFIEDISFNTDYFTNSFPANIYITYLPVYLCRRLYGFDLDLKTVDIEQLADLVNIVLNQRKNVSEENSEKETFYIVHRVLPGLFLPIFKSLELNNRKEICYVLLDQYILQVFSECPWQSNNIKIEIEIMSVLFESYADFIFSLIMGDNYELNMKDTDYRYSRKCLLEEMTGKQEGIFISKGKAFWKDYVNTGVYFKKIFDEGANQLKQVLPEYIYSFFILYTIFILYCTELKKLAIQHLLDNYDEIRVEDKRCLYFQVLLGRCIMECEQLETANSLYGYFNFEMDRWAREKDRIFSYIESMTAYLCEVKEEIRVNDFHTFETKESWYDIIFKKSGIENFIDEIKEKCDKNILIEERDFRKLLIIIEAFTNPSGIYLTLLNLPKYDGDDKVYGVLSYELQMRGNEFTDQKKNNEYILCYNSKKQIDIRQDANLFFQQHISELTDATIEKSIKQINNLKRQYLSNSHAMTEEEMELLHSDLDVLHDNLVNKLVNHKSSRYDVENTLVHLQKKFINNYGVNANEDLTHKLPLNLSHDVQNYLVTAEIVYMTLSARRDVEELDFSAALISLTKVIEVVFNYIFDKMQVKYDSTIIEKNLLRQYFTKKKEKKSHIEFGPGVVLLQDVLFEEWNGKDVVDISKLWKYKGLHLITGRKEDGTWYEESFREDDQYNRNLLKASLLFVKDEYRNIGAHCDSVKLSKLEEARELLLMTESLIWVLLDILKDTVLEN